MVSTVLAWCCSGRSYPRDRIAGLPRLGGNGLLVVHNAVVDYDVQRGLIWEGGAARIGAKIPVCVQLPSCGVYVDEAKISPAISSPGLHPLPGV